MADLKAIAEKIANLTVKESQELLEIFKEDYGIEPANSGIVFEDAPAIEVEVKSTFDVIIKSAGGQKLQVVKMVKELTSLGLKESKEIVDKAPIALKEGISEEEANMLKTKLEEVGAEIELK